MLSLSYFIGLPSLSRLLRNSLVVLTRPHFRKSFAIALDSLSVLLRLDVLLRSTALLSPNSSYDHYPRTVQLTARFFRRLVSLHSHLSPLTLGAMTDVDSMADVHYTCRRTCVVPPWRDTLCNKEARRRRHYKTNLFAFSRSKPQILGKRPSLELIEILFSLRIDYQAVAGLEECHSSSFKVSLCSLNGACFPSAVNLSQPQVG